jgi:hypothetical protein
VQARHDTPDANLAWLMAVLAEPPQQQQQQQQVSTVSPGQTSHLDQMLATSKAALEAMLEDRKDRVTAAATFLAMPYQGIITGYSYRDGPKGMGYYSTTAQPDQTIAQYVAAAAAGSSGGDGAGSSKAAAAAAAAAGSSGAGGSNADVARADEDVEAVDCVTDVLQKLAHLSKGIR